MTHRTAILALAFAAALAACGRAARPVGIGPAVTPPAPFFAALFEDGRTWTYDAEHVVDEWNPDAPDADDRGLVHVEETVTATCRVVETGVLPNGRISRIACEGLDTAGQDPISGVWAYDPRGLWKIDREVAAGEIPAMPAETMLLAAAPTPSSEAADEVEVGDSAVSVQPDGDGWCRTVETNTEDELWTTLCFGPAGITRGSSGYAAGPEHRTTFTLRPGE